MEDEEYSVYDVVIEKVYLGPKTKQVVIRDQTTSNHYVEAIPGKEDESGQISADFSSLGLEGDTLASYLSKNKTVSPLQNYFKLSVPAIVLSDQELDALAKRNALPGRFWLEFFRQYPNTQGVITFSRVGFNSAMDQAFVYFENNCGGLCGVGEYCLLVKQNGSWQIKKQKEAWIS